MPFLFLKEEMAAIRLFISLFDVGFLTENFNALAGH